jgi:AraC-like DNA-binding protein
MKANYMSIRKERYYRTSGTTPPVRVHPVFQDFHKLSADADYEYPAHTHTNYEVIVVEEGPYHCCLNGTETRVDSGEFLVIKPGDQHQDHLRRGQFHYVLHFALVSDLPGAGGSMPLFRPDVEPHSQRGQRSFGAAFAFFRQLEDELRQNDRFSSFLQDSLLATFFWQLVRHLPADALSAPFQLLSRQAAFRARLDGIFSVAYQGSLSMDDLAAELGISKRTLAYRCRELLGTSPARAFACYRIARAAELLSAGDQTVQEVSQALGFSNPFHFSRLFKSILGRSPRRYQNTADGD